VALGPDDLVLCSGTLPRDVSFHDRVEAAAAAGFAGISLWGRDHQRARHDGLTDSDIRAMLKDNGLTVAELDPAWWWLPGAEEVGRTIPLSADTEAVFRYGEAELFRIADAVRARSLNAVDVFGGDWDLDAAAEAFAALCDRAAEHGLLVHLEALPWSKLPDVATTWEVARRADRPNGGVMVDAWHFVRGGAVANADALKKVPGDRVFGIQVDDGPLAPEANLVEATLHERRLPGEGEFDLAGLLDILDDIGAVAPLGVEVFSDDLHAQGPHEAAKRAGNATRALLST
jgi:sugar phosphate isomerase/epimerase